MSVSARANVLRALQLAGARGCTTAELCAPGVGGERFGSRLHELRHQEHWQITTKIERPGSARYTLTGRNEPPVYPDDWVDDEGFIHLDFSGGRCAPPLRSRRVDLQEAA